MIVLPSWDEMEAVLGAYERDKARLDRLQRDVFLEFNQYLISVSHTVAATVSRAWNVSYENI